MKSHSSPKSRETLLTLPLQLEASPPGPLGYQDPASVFASPPPTAPRRQAFVLRLEGIIWLCWQEPRRCLTSALVQPHLLPAGSWRERQRQGEAEQHLHSPGLGLNLQGSLAKGV